MKDLAQPAVPLTKDEALKLAKECGATTYTNRHYPDATAVTFGPLAWEKFCKQALAAQPAVQEPFGYLNIEDIESHSEYPHNCRSVNLWHEGGEGMVAIYTTPPAPAQRQWVGLTQKQKAEIAEDWAVDVLLDIAEVVACIEAKLKEKNT